MTMSSTTGKDDQTHKFWFAFPKSLVWKIILPVPLVLILGVVALVSWLPGAMRDNTEKAAIAAATTTVGQFKIIRGYYTKNVIKKALASGALKPSIDHKGKPGTIPLPATLIHDLSKLLSSGGTRVSLFSAFPFPNRKERNLDDFQKEAWKAINANPDKPYIRKEMVDGKTMIRVGIADKMVAQGCVNCHNSRADTPKNDWKLGDVRGILEVSTAIDDQLAAGALLSNKTALGVAVFGAIIIALIVLVSILFVRKPVGRLAVVMEKMAAGDHDDQIPGVQSRDELGVIARSMQVWKANHAENNRLSQERADADKAQREAERERGAAERQEADRHAAEKEQAAELARQRASEMEEKISKFDSEVGSVLDKVSTAVDEMRASAESMTSTAEETAQKSTTVAAAAEQATNNIQMVAAAAEELSASVGEISRQVADSANIAKGAVTEATNTNEKIQGLAEAAQKIGDVISLINDIASQTNLLALNATIEAARAGDAGKGFAVVASEVKSLATQTAKATEEISGQITAIQEATSEAVVAIDGISGVIGQINEISTAIASAVEEQGASSQEIAGNVQQAAAGTQEITNDITEVNRTASETGEVAKKVLDAAGELSRQGDGLRRHIDAFLESMRVA